MIKFIPIFNIILCGICPPTATMIWLSRRGHKLCKEVKIMYALIMFAELSLLAIMIKYL